MGIIVILMNGQYTIGDADNGNFQSLGFMHHPVVPVPTADCKIRNLPEMGSGKHKKLFANNRLVTPARMAIGNQSLNLILISKIDQVVDLQIRPATNRNEIGNLAAEHQSPDRSHKIWQQDYVAVAVRQQRSDAMVVDKLECRTQQWRSVTIGLNTRKVPHARRTSCLGDTLIIASENDLNERRQLPPAVDGISLNDVDPPDERFRNRKDRQLRFFVDGHRLLGVTHRARDHVAENFRKLIVSHFIT